MKHRRLMDVDVQGKKVLVRVDFNVPLKDGKIRDDTRIRAALPTLEYLLKEGAMPIVLSHLGRPKGKVVDELRLDPVAQRLSDLLEQEVLKVDEVRGPEVIESVESMEQGQIMLLENTRFDPGETKNDDELAAFWASLGELFVNDAFGAAHRAHSSNVGLGSRLPAVAGFLMDNELNALGRLLEEDVQRPYIAILGGAKISDKIGVIQALLSRVDALLLGGGMANTFLAAQGWSMGDSLLEKEEMQRAGDIMTQAREQGKELILPRDLMISQDLEGKGSLERVSASPIPPGWKAIDLGPQTLEEFKDILKDAATVFWNGPLGMFEVEAFARGTNELAHFLTDIKAWTVIGGGDSAAAVEACGLAGKMGHISTGGGASLEYLEKGDLPGIAILREG